MAYVYKRGRVWWVGYRDSAGTSIQEPTKARSKTEAKSDAIELERKAYRARKNLEPEVGTDTLFEKRALEWLSKLPKEYRSKSTAETYLRQRIFPFLGKNPCRSITRDDVRSMLKANETDRAGKDSKGRPIILKAAKEGTREKLRGYVHSIFEWLIDDLEVVFSRNPAGGKRMRLKPPKQLPRYVPVPELVALTKEIPEHYRLLFIFAVVSGVRKGELIPLLWEEVRLEQRQVLIKKSLDHSTTKGRKERLVVIPTWLLPLFEDERALGRSQYVFANEKGKKHRFDVKLTRMMRAAAKRAGLITGFLHVCRRRGCKFSEERPTSVQEKCPRCTFKLWVEPIARQYRFKDLRSTFGTLATAESGDLRYVQQVLGHASFGTTEGHYVHALTSGLHAKTDALRTFDPLAGAVSDLSAAAAESARKRLRPTENNGRIHERE